MSNHIVRPDRIVCGNCGIQIKPDPIKEEGSCAPLEQIVQDDETVRQSQYDAAMKGIEYRHSLMIASNWSTEYRGAQC